MSEYVKYKGSCYGVSPEGEVVNLNNGCVKSQHPDASGYLRTNLHINGKSESYLIHRLVAECYLDVPPDLKRPAVKHINGDTRDNRVENLQWVDYGSMIKGLHGEGRYVKHLNELHDQKTRRGIRRIDLLNVKEINFDSVLQAAIYLKSNTDGVTENLKSICSNINGAITNSRMAYGYLWKLV